jgi:hypothetical protein
MKLESGPVRCKGAASMKPNVSRVITWIVFSIILVLFVEPAESTTLEGTVLGQANNRKPFVRVEIAGPGSKTTFTDKDGKFSLELEGGQYTVQVIEMNRAKQFTVNVPSEGKIQSEFKLPW